MIFTNVEKKVEVDIDGKKAIIRPLSMVNDSFGFVTFQMEWDGYTFTTHVDEPYLNIEDMQVQVSWDEDFNLIVTILPGED